MAELRCPKCGKSNPDLLDVCQFCQTPLKKSDSVLRIGQTPTKKDTGELEGVLPDWLKDVRSQARATAEEEAAQAAAHPQTEKEESPDLLAGLVSQSDSADDDEIPDWLASINPVAGPTPVVPSAGAKPATPEPETDFFAQFNQKEEKPASEPLPKSTPASIAPVADQPPASADDDDLSKWFARASEQPEEIIEIDADAQFQGAATWGRDSDSPLPPAQEQEPAPKEEEDLSWLHNLENVAKQTGDLQAPKPGTDWAADFETPAAPSGPSAGREDLSWLDNLGGVEAQQNFEQPAAAGDDLSWLRNLDAVTNPPPVDAAPEKPAAAPPFASGEDLSWLKNLDGAPIESQPVETAPASSQEDLSWLNDLGGAPAEAQPAEVAPAPSSGEDLSWLKNLGDMPVESQPVEAVPTSSQEDLSWLQNLGGTPVESQPVEAALAPSQDDLSWLSDLGGETQSAPPFPEPEAAASGVPMASKSGKEEMVEPDWLTNAIEASAASSAGDASMDWFASKEQPVEEPAPPVGTAPVSQPPPFADAFSTPSEPSSLPGQDVDSLFSVEMPDWLSHSEPAVETAPRGAALPPAEIDESLAPVDLPSWVQAMRPVEAVISETAPDTAEEPEEKEGPLAGLRGVIPGAALGLSSKPKAISLKLQATNEQQASAALLESILGSETSPRPLVISSFVTSQTWLRRVLAVLILVVLSGMIVLQSTMLPVSAALPPEAEQASIAVESLPANANVLVVIDYEASLAGEMEAVSGPLLVHTILLRNPQLSFVSMTPSGLALVERLMSSERIKTLNPQYRNLGFLPGGSTGILGFVEGPSATIPVSDAEKFSNYAMVILMTDHAESGRVWVEQLYAQKQRNPELENQPLVVIASAQAGPLLQPYVSSKQINGIVSGLSEAVRYEYKKALPPVTRSYWDTFGVGLTIAVLLIVLGSLWSLVTGIRARRAEAEQG
jgi:hypothetical protein